MKRVFKIFSRLLPSQAKTKPDPDPAPALKRIVKIPAGPGQCRCLIRDDVTEPGRTKIIDLGLMAVKTKRKK